MGRAFAAILLAAGLAGCTNVFFQPARRHFHTPAAAGVDYRAGAPTASAATTKEPCSSRFSERSRTR